MTSWQEQVLAHGPLTQLADGLWVVHGSLRRGKMPRAMVVYRLPTGGLLLHSVVALNAEAMAQLESYGRPEVMIVPNGMHRLDAPVYKKRYPGLRVLCPAAARGKVEERLPVDATCEEALPALGVIAHAPSGLAASELVYELALRNGKALVVTDALMNMQHLPGAEGFFLRLLGSTGFFGITRIGRLLLLKNRQEFKAWLSAMAKRPELKLVTLAHGDAITEQIGARLAEAAARL